MPLLQTDLRILCIVSTNLGLGKRKLSCDLCSWKDGGGFVFCIERLMLGLGSSSCLFTHNTHGRGITQVLGVYDAGNLCGSETGQSCLTAGSDPRINTCAISGLLEPSPTGQIQLLPGTRKAQVALTLSWTVCSTPLVYGRRDIMALTRAVNRIFLWVVK